MIPEITFATLDDCHSATDVVVVIDVCRAFTTAAYAFGAGAERIYVTGTVQEALGLKNRIPGALLDDLQLCMTLDHFDFALQVTRQDGLLVMEKEYDDLP